MAVKDLSRPSPQLAAHLLRELDFKERLSGVRMMPMGGEKHISLYRFQDLVDFLHVDLGDGPEKTSGSIGYMDLAGLAESIEAVFGDKELALAIKEEVARGSSYAERVRAIGGLLERRLKQCEKIVAASIQTQPGGKNSIP